MNPGINLMVNLKGCILNSSCSEGAIKQNTHKGKKTKKVSVEILQIVHTLKKPSWFDLQSVKAGIYNCLMAVLIVGDRIKE